VLLCVSGGGSRAAAWTMKVLTELEKRVEAKEGCKWSLPYHIRVVSGASGGILGASYYVSTLDKPDANHRPPPSRYDENGLLAELNKTIRGDFLTYIVHTMLTRDLPGLFLPRFLPPLAGYDRGHAFEWAMEQMLRGGLTQTFDSLMKDEADGWRPSLVFSPMMVEDGRQLLISNLDLLDVLHNTGKGFDPAGPEELLSREAVEFFRLFPHATDFRVGTAARMSGTFPYVLPAVPLPTHPRRRVVDAGYFDNYGVGVAASWLFNNLDWVGKVANKVAIVQIRDGLSVDERLMTRPTDPPPTAAELAAEWLTTPPAGLYQARVSANMLRNDNLLHLLHDRMAQRFKGTLPFVTPAFELPAGGDVSLSYTLTEAEQRLIDDCLPGTARRPDDAKLAQEVDQLEARVNAFVEWFAAERPAGG
jgi:predicted acylesterase/phospholipase RssA